ncbi:MAG: class I SAM-dependent methyltransferase [Verrucomicrobiota bacterium]|nr:class I SAM-dependent methyltransferase [Verrucomicrobiota bacterium]
MIPNQILNTILTERMVPRDNGDDIKLTSSISLVECEALYAFLRERKPELVLEIGMAHGVSSQTILTALKENEKGQLISLDPYHQWESARLAALDNIKKAGLASRHRHIHAGSEMALPKLCAEGMQAEFVHIDGHHGFDHAFVDWFYADLLLPVGGVVAFDDSGWRGVHKTIRYLLTHRKYRELDVGLKRTYSGKTFLHTMVKRIEGRFGTTRYFEKVEQWAAPYDFYKSF